MDYLHNHRLNRNISLLRLFRDLLRCNVEAFFDPSDLAPFYVHVRETVGYIRALTRPHAPASGPHRPG